MNRPLAHSAFFSVGLHLFLLVPVFSVGVRGPDQPSRADFHRGESSVELELMELDPSAGGQPIWAKPAVAVQAWADDGAQADWKIGGLQNDPPRYPLTARVQGWEGTVVVRARVGPSGQVEQVEVGRGSGHDILDQAALTSIRAWKFQPARRKGRAWASWVEIPVSFRLQTDQRR